MALFEGEEMVSVTTPDGRTLTIPRSLATSMAPQQLAAQPPQAPPGVAPLQPQPEVPVAPQPVAEAVPGGPATAPAPGAPQMPPEYAPPSKAQAAQEKQAARQAQQRAAYNASPEGQLDATQRRQDKASVAERHAAANVATIEGAEQDVIARAVTQRNAQLDELAVKRAQAANEAAQNEAAQMAKVTATRDKIANTKIDRGIDHPVIAAISVALAGLGTAMKGETVNPALEMVFKMIDRKVSAQMQDLDLLEKQYGFDKDDLAMVEKSGAKRLEVYNTLMSAEMAKHVRTVEGIQANSASAKTQANSAVLQAQLESAAAVKATEAARWRSTYEQQKQQHKESISVQRGNLGESIRHNKASEQLERDKIAADALKDRGAGAAASAKLNAELTKEIKEKGLKGADGTYLLTPRGKQKLAEADRWEREANDIEAKAGSDPMALSIKSDAINMRRQRAAELRDEASRSVVTAHSPEQAGKIGEKQAAVQAMADNVDHIKMIYDEVGRGKITIGSVQKDLQSSSEQLKLQLKQATGSGAYDKGLDNLFKVILSSDPSSSWTAGVLGFVGSGLKGTLKRVEDPEAFKAALDSVIRNATNDAKQQVRYMSDWDGKDDTLFTRKSAPVETENDKASQKILQGYSDAEREKSDEHTPFESFTKGVDAGGVVKRAIDKAEKPDYLGLNRDQDEALGGLFSRHNAGDHAATASILSTVSQAVQTRPDLAVPLLKNIHDYAGNIYPAARALVPKGSELENALLYSENIRVGTALTPVQELRQKVLGSMDMQGNVGDTAGKEELARIAGNPNHPAQAEARAALKEIIDATGAPAPGSIFGGR